MTAHSPPPEPPSPPGSKPASATPAPSSGLSAAQSKRERILGAAEIVFARSGFFNARVSEIAKEAGVADGTIYLYFKSKDDLLISVFEARIEFVTSQLAAAIAPLQSPRDQLIEFVRTYLGLVKANPAVADVLTVELRQSTKFMKEYANTRFGEFLKLLAAIIAAGQKTGEFHDTIPPQHAARMIFGLIDELALAWLLGHGEKFDIVRAADWVGTLIMKGLEQRRDL